jgi:hypothetical protein
MPVADIDIDSIDCIQVACMKKSGENILPQFPCHEVTLAGLCVIYCEGY